MIEWPSRARDPRAQRNFDYLKQFIDLNNAQHTIADEGVALPDQPVLDFQGAGVTATDGVGKTVVTVPGGSPGHVIEDEGTPLTQRSNMNFTGVGVAVTDSGGKTVVTIAGGGGGAVTFLDIFKWGVDSG